MASGNPIPTHHQFQDLRERRFGKLLVKEYMGSHPIRKRSLWRCECDCGGETVVCSRELLSNGRSKVRSCGCLKTPPLEECLRRRVRGWGGDPAECWEWTGGHHNFGYGSTTYRGKQYSLPRLVYEKYVGPIPEGLHVLHRCDNPPCCNPAHLYVGTHRDNMADMKRRGRAHGAGLSGEDNGSAKLTAAQVLEIVTRSRAGESDKKLAEVYGVSDTAISFIMRGRSWRRVTGIKPGQVRTRKAHGGYYKLTAEQALDIYRKCRDGERSRGEMARMYGVTTGAVQAILEGRSWNRVTGLPVRVPEKKP